GEALHIFQALLRERVIEAWTEETPEELVDVVLGMLVGPGRRHGFAGGDRPAGIQLALAQLLQGRRSQMICDICLPGLLYGLRRFYQMARAGHACLHREACSRLFMLLSDVIRHGV